MADIVKLLSSKEQEELRKMLEFHQMHDAHDYMGEDGCCFTGCSPSLREHLLQALKQDLGEKG